MSVVDAATLTIDTLDLADASNIQSPGIQSSTRPNNDAAKAIDVEVPQQVEQ